MVLKWSRQIEWLKAALDEISVSTKIISKLEKSSCLKYVYVFVDI